jgi:hypothetical protein
MLDFLFARNYTVYWDITLKGYVPHSLYVGDGFDDEVNEPGYAGPNLLAVASDIASTLPARAKELLSQLTPLELSKPLSDQYSDVGGVRAPYIRAGVVTSRLSDGVVEVAMQPESVVAVSLSGNIHA